MERSYDIQRILLHAVMKELFCEIEEKPDCLHVRALAIELLLYGKKMQVHVLVTQDADDFLQQDQIEVLHLGTIE